MESFRLLVNSTDSSKHFPIAVQRLFDGWLQSIESRIHSHLINIGEEANGAEITVAVTDFGMLTERILTHERCQRSLAVHVTGQFATHKLDFKVAQFVFSGLG